MKITSEMPPGWTDHGLEGDLSGYWCEGPDAITVPFLESRSPHAFLAFLSAIEQLGKKIIFPTVLNGRLAVLLEKRGYHYSETAMYAEEVKEWCDGYVKEDEVIP